MITKQKTRDDGVALKATTALDPGQCLFVGWDAYHRAERQELGLLADGIPPWTQELFVAPADYDVLAADVEAGT